MLRFKGQFNRFMARHFSRRRAERSSPSPLISFTFDDFPRTALTAGGKLLLDYGWRGTYYAAIGLMDKVVNDELMFTRADLGDLLTAGHELGCHTFDHSPCSSVSAGKFVQSCADNRRNAVALLSGYELQNFSFPHGQVTMAAKYRLRSIYDTCRSIEWGVNSDPADLGFLRANPIYSRYSISTVKQLIQENIAVNGWLIFYTHDVASNPSRVGCTPEYLEEVLRCALESGADVLTIREAACRYQLEKVVADSIAPQYLADRRARLLPVRALSEADYISQRRVTAESDAAQGTGGTSLVSILIPAYNAEESIAETIRSALAQTWEPKEIIVVDDGSNDRTLELACRFESDFVIVVSQTHQGASAARNKALALCRGEYIQWLDADDTLAPSKVAKQMEVAAKCAGKRTLFSSAWGQFLYRPDDTTFVPSTLWCDLSPVEFLLRKMGRNIFMQTATWLVSRELTNAAGPWSTVLSADDDGEYFCRVLLASDGIRFVSESKVHYRYSGTRGLAYIGDSFSKMDSKWRSMQLHIKYIRGLEDSERVLNACLEYLQVNLIDFYPERLDIVQQMCKQATEIGGQLEPPRLSWKFSWMRRFCGWAPAKKAQLLLPHVKLTLVRSLHKLYANGLSREERSKDLETGPRWTQRTDGVVLQGHASETKSGTRAARR